MEPSARARGYELATTIALDSYLKRSGRLTHVDLSNTFLGERAVHYLVKRLEKSTTIQSVHFSGMREQIRDSTKEFIRETLNPICLHSEVSHTWDEKLFAKIVDDHRLEMGAVELEPELSKEERIVGKLNSDDGIWDDREDV